MSTADKMNIDERRKYLRLMQKRYAQVPKKKQRQLLNELEAITELRR